MQSPGLVALLVQEIPDSQRIFASGYGHHERPGLEIDLFQAPGQGCMYKVHKAVRAEVGVMGGQVHFGLAPAAIAFGPARQRPIEAQDGLSFGLLTGGM